MQNHVVMFRFAVALSILLVGSFGKMHSAMSAPGLTAPVNTGPLNPLNVEEAENFLEFKTSDPDFARLFADSKAKAQHLHRIAARKLSQSPDSPAAQSEMGSTLHWLGHMAEVENDFELALSYHRASLKYYRQSGGVTANGSWDDGVNHALEHIFMDLYDRGVILEREGRIEEARRSFREAWKFEQAEELRQTYDVGRDHRFLSRLTALEARPDYHLITMSTIERLRGGVGRLFGFRSKPTTPAVRPVTCESLFASSILN